MTWQRWKLTWHLSPKLVRHSPQRLSAVPTSMSSPPCISSPHLYQQSPLVPAVPTSISSPQHLSAVPTCISMPCLYQQFVYHDTWQAHQLHWWAIVEGCCLQIMQTRYKKLTFCQVLLGHVNMECLHSAQQFE